MKKSRRRSLIGVVALFLSAVQQGDAYQRNAPVTAPTRPDYSSPQNNTNIIPGRTTPIEDSSMMREMEERRGKAINSERQRMMVKEANQLMQTAAELQVELTRGVDGAAREEQAKRAEAIEKLARNVKDRMKGSR